ncbi:MAG: PEPxxWA-CTERM sorting domain-containing protein [Pseudomonadota bacterium]
MIALVAAPGMARAECETRVSKVAMPAAAPSAGRLNMMLVKSRALVGERPVAKPRKAAVHRAKLYRRAKAKAGAHAGAKPRRRQLAAAASRPKRPTAPRAVPAAPLAVAAAPAFADIRTEVCTNGPEPILAMLARLTAPPEPQQSKVGSAAAPLDGAVTGPTDLADLGSDGVAPGVISKPPTATPGTTFLPPTVTPTTDPDDDPLAPTPPFTTQPVSPTDPSVDPLTGRPVSPLDGGPTTSPTTTSPTTTTPTLVTTGPTTGPGPTGPQTGNPPGPLNPTSPTPEPATWALLIAGFGLAGARLRAGARRGVAR